jgi:hypothetical protein
MLNWLVLVACSGRSVTNLPQATVPQVVPTAATVVALDLGVPLDAHAGLHPSGRVLTREMVPLEGAGIEQADWCLHEEGRKPRCLRSDTSDTRCLGRSRTFGWRADREAIVLCGESMTRDADGSGAGDSLDAILDFAEGRVVHIRPEDHRTMPVWTTDGQRVVAFGPGKRPHRPWGDAEVPVVTLDPFVPGMAPRPASASSGLPAFWAMQRQRGGGIVRLAPPAMAPVAFQVGKGTQEPIDWTPDARFVVVEDDDVDHGQGGPDDPPWRVVDGTDGTVHPIARPDGFRYGTDCVISDDGRSLLAVWSDRRGIHLSTRPVRAGAWTTLHSWDREDPDRPRENVSDGEIAWNGGDTAWIAATSGKLLKVSLR